MHLHERECPVAPGAIVPVDIAIDPVGWRLERGQTLRLRVSGSDLVPNVLPDVKPAPPRGNACFSIWCGGEFDSHAWIPLTAPLTMWGSPWRRRSASIFGRYPSPMRQSTP